MIFHRALQSVASINFLKWLSFRLISKLEYTSVDIGWKILAILQLLDNFAFRRLESFVEFLVNMLQSFATCRTVATHR